MISGLSVRWTHEYANIQLRSYRLCARTEGILLSTAEQIAVARAASSAEVSSSSELSFNNLSCFSSDLDAQSFTKSARLHCIPKLDMSRFCVLVYPPGVSLCLRSTVLVTAGRSTYALNCSTPFEASSGETVDFAPTDRAGIVNETLRPYR